MITACSVVLARIGEPGTESIQKAVQLAAHRNEFNPLRDRLERAQMHDGTAAGDMAGATTSA
jgi:hypothetical protein